MSNYLKRPTGFQDEIEKSNYFYKSTEISEEKNYMKAFELKNKALKEISLIDEKQYTDESLKRRDELIEIINNCNNVMNRYSRYKMDNRLIKCNIEAIDDSSELLEVLCEKNDVNSNMERDKKNIQKFLECKKNDLYRNFMYEESKAENNVNPLNVQYSVDSTKSSDAFIISNTGKEPEQVSDINYRITLRNSNNLKEEDVLSFIQTFQSEALKRNIYARCKILFEQSDGIIFYVDKNNLLETTRLLEDLKDENTYGIGVTNAIKSFGNPQPFSAILSDNSYYSIAMHGVESNSKLKTTLGGGLVKTFNGYMDDCLEFVYNKLLMRYNNDINKINIDEFYKELITYHKSRMDVGEEIPLWMNNRIYDDLNSKKLLK